MGHALWTFVQFCLTFFAFLCNCALIFLLATREHALKSAGKGLVITTFAQFLTHLAYSIIMVGDSAVVSDPGIGLSRMIKRETVQALYSYFPPPLSNASMLTTIALDAISLCPVWLLLVFSGRVRRAVLQGLQGLQGLPRSERWSGNRQKRHLYPCELRTWWRRLDGCSGEKGS